MIPRVRVVAGANGEGARRLAARGGLIYNTFKNLTRSLSDKFALDIVKPERNGATAYAVYHYSAILQRQRQAGFTSVIHRNGGGRQLVDAQSRPAPRRGDLSVEDLERILAAPNIGALDSSSAAPNFGAPSDRSGAPKIAATIRNKEYTSKSEATSSTSAAANPGAPKIVLDALFERTGRADSEAARVIVRGCTEACPGIRAEEISRLIRTTPIPATIENPVGLLIRALPKHCAPESIQTYRQHWRREEEQETHRREQERTQAIKTARSILEGTARGEQWDDSAVAWAKDILGENTPESTLGKSTDGA
jgi:hypothetical protein